MLITKRNKETGNIVQFEWDAPGDPPEDLIKFEDEKQNRTTFSEKPNLYEEPGPITKTGPSSFNMDFGSATVNPQLDLSKLFAAAGDDIPNYQVTPNLNPALPAVENITAGTETALKPVDAVLGVLKSGVNEAARGGREVLGVGQGINEPTESVENIFQEALTPHETHAPSFLDKIIPTLAAAAGGSPESAAQIKDTIENNPQVRALVQGGEKLSGIALDPLMYAGLGPLSKVASPIFGGLGVRGLYHKLPEYVKTAQEKGITSPEFIEQTPDVLASSAMTVLPLKHALSERVPPISDVSERITENKDITPEVDQRGDELLQDKYLPRVQRIKDRSRIVSTYADQNAARMSGHAIRNMTKASMIPYKHLGEGLHVIPEIDNDGNVKEITIVSTGKEGPEAGAVLQVENKILAPDRIRELVDAKRTREITPEESQELDDWSRENLTTNVPIHKLHSTEGLSPEDQATTVAGIYREPNKPGTFDAVRAKMDEFRTARSIPRVTDPLIQGIRQRHPQDVDLSDIDKLTPEEAEAKIDKAVKRQPTSRSTISPFAAEALNRRKASGIEVNAAAKLAQDHPEKLSELTGLSPKEITRGVMDMARDGQWEFAPEASAIKKVIRNDKGYFDDRVIRKHFGRLNIPTEEGLHVAFNPGGRILLGNRQTATRFSRGKSELSPVEDVRTENVEAPIGAPSGLGASTPSLKKFKDTQTYEELFDVADKIKGALAPHYEKLRLARGDQDKYNYPIKDIPIKFTNHPSSLASFSGKSGPSSGELRIHIESALKNLIQDINSPSNPARQHLVDMLTSGKTTLKDELIHQTLSNMIHELSHGVDLLGTSHGKIIGWNPETLEPRYQQTQGQRRFEFLSSIMRDLANKESNIGKVYQEAQKYDSNRWAADVKQAYGGKPGAYHPAFETKIPEPTGVVSGTGKGGKAVDGRGASLWGKIRNFFGGGKKPPTGMNIPDPGDKGDPIAKLRYALSKAEPMTEEQAKLTASERKARAQRLLSAGGKYFGQEWYRQTRKALAGSYEKIQWKPIEGISDVDRDTLFEYIKNSKAFEGSKSPEFERARAGEAIAKMLNPEGYIQPEPNELKTLDKVFGSGPEGAHTALSQIITELARMHRPSAPATALGYARAVAGSIKAGKATADISYFLRQGLFIGAGNPGKWISSLRGGIHDAFSSTHYENTIQSIENDPHRQLQLDSGLKLTLGIGPNQFSSREEAFVNSILHKFPVLGPIQRGFERGYVGGLNKLKNDVFNGYADEFARQGITWDNDPKAYKDIAKWVNDGSGRGSLGKFESAQKVLNDFFFSPRFNTSRLRILRLTVDPTAYKDMNPAVRKKIIKDLLSAYGLVGMTLGLAKLNGRKVDEDPRSSDFIKIKDGNSRIDLTAGLQPWLRLIAQVYTGKRVKEEKVEKLDFGNTLANFTRYKLAPVPGMMWSAKTGKTVSGKPFPFNKDKSVNWDAVFDEIGPMMINDIRDVLNDPESAPWMLPLGVLGASVQTYKPKTPSKVPLYPSLKSVQPVQP